MTKLHRSWKNGLFAAVVSAAAVAPLSQALAHPHEFVTMRVEVNFNKAGKVSGMRYHWTFDPFFTAYAVEGQDKNKNGKAEQNELDALLLEILGNIKRIDYFTAFEKNAVVPKIDTAKPVAATMKGNVLSISFDVPFKTPVNVNSKKLRYAIYDDEFYIAMNHDTKDIGVKLNNAPKGCSWKLDQPDPAEDIVAFATSLGRDQSPGSDLGINFAEWVAISCK